MQLKSKELLKTTKPQIETQMKLPQAARNHINIMDQQSNPAVPSSSKYPDSKRKDSISKKLADYILEIQKNKAKRLPSNQSP